MKNSLFFLFFILISMFMISNFIVYNCDNFEVRSISINDKKYKVLEAKTECQKEIGLMNKLEVPERGMLFVFSEAKKLNFWMKNTKIPLSIAYLDNDGNILEIHKMEVEDPMTEDRKLRQYPSSFNAKYALEVDPDFFSKEQIKIGDKVEMESR